VSGELVGGRYRLEKRLGAGAMSEVWAAHDTQLDRRVALKLMDAAADRLRFEREARTVAGLSHPNICLIYDYGESGERRYLALEYLSGGTLEERLVPGKPLADRETARLAAQLASALAHAHERGVLHRDLKPSNVIFDEEGNAKLADFGIARIGDASTLTEAGTMLGTAAYISPEQARGEPVTAATDVYAFGVILYRLLAGRLPFEAEGPLELALMHVNREPAPISSLRSDAPPALERVATWSLAKAPSERPQDGAALVAALAQSGPALAEDETLLMRQPETLVMRPPRRSNRARYLAAAIALALLGLAGAALAVLANDEPSPPPATPTTQPAPPPATTTGPTTTSVPTTTEATTSEQATTTEPATTTATTATTAPTTEPPPTTDSLTLPTEPVTTTVGTVTVTTPTVP
jgi:eukaryotic-like serine/threonine-protein kinase